MNGSKHIKMFFHRLKKMRNYLKVVVLALAGVAISGNAYSVPASFSFSLAADPTSAASYDVSGMGFTEIHRLGLAAPSGSAAVTLSYRGRPRAQPDSLLTMLQDIGVSSNAGGVGDAGVSASAGRDIQRGNAGVTLASANPASGYSGFQPRGAAVGTQGGDYQVAENAGRGSEPKTLALVLAGLILMGSIVHRRIQQQ